MPMLSSKNKDAKVLDVKTVTHNSQKRKLVLLEDGNVYKIKKSKLEDHVHQEEHCLNSCSVVNCLSLHTVHVVLNNKCYRKYVVRSFLSL